MSVKRTLIIAAAAAFGVSAAYAGGPDMMAAPVASSSFTPYFYAELGTGYATTNYQAQYEGINDISLDDYLTNDSNTNGGWAFAGDFGYEFMPHLAVELGGGYLPTAKFDLAAIEVLGSDATTGNELKSWYGYGAVRVDTGLQMNDKINLFAKAGVAYRNLSDKDDDTDSVSENYWAPMFGAGVSYDINDNIYASAEMNYIGSTTKTSEDGVSPAATVYMAKVGYKFNF
jgi:opacity protein-like surface antigen